MTGDRERKGWERAVREHRAALSAFREIVSRAEEASWREPVGEGEGKWTRAQVAEHLVLTHQAVLKEVEQGQAMAPRVGGAVRTVLRWLLLPHVLFHRSIPVRARTPREARPSPEGLDAAVAGERLPALGLELEGALGRRRGAYVTHPYFGRLPALRALRFLAVHIEHHLRQMDPAGSRRTPPKPEGGAPAAPERRRGEAPGAHP